MNVKYEFGKFKMKISYDGNEEDLFTGNTLFDNELFRCYLELLGKMHEGYPPNILGYYNGVNKLFEDYLKANKVYADNNKASIISDPNIMPASGHDIYNYVSRYGLTDCQIQVIMKLDGHLNYNKLTNAVKLSVDDQPVFGCRFIEDTTPYWKPFENLDQVNFCTYEETSNADESVNRFLKRPLDMDNDPMVKLRLIRSEECDTLCFKLNHSCCDGAGIKEYIKLLSEIYSSIDCENGIFIPLPNKRGRKEQDALFKSLGITNPDSEWIEGSEVSRVTWPFTWNIAQSEARHYVVCRLPKGQIKDIKQYSREKGATINDIILTAYYRALSEMSQPQYNEAMDISITVDLRRYLPKQKTEAIRNFSGSENTSIYLLPDETFEETLSKVVSETNRIKNSQPGLQSALGLERLEKLAFPEVLSYYNSVSQWACQCNDKCAPVLSNVGNLSEGLLKFGEVTAVDAYMVPHTVHAPGFLLLANTYNDTLTLSTAFYDGTIEHEDSIKLINKVKDEILKNCTC
ncbi:MAG: condensation protein [Clostridiaceae bacterium]|nr:condensation protein [Clostridiaceae bacterium]